MLNKLALNASEVSQVLPTGYSLQLYSVARCSVQNNKKRTNYEINDLHKSLISVPSRNHFSIKPHTFLG
jgi:hypothetical protein